MDRDRAWAEREREERRAHVMPRTLLRAFTAYDGGHLVDDELKRTQHAIKSAHLHFKWQRSYRILVATLDNYHRDYCSVNAAIKRFIHARPRMKRLRAVEMWRRAHGRHSGADFHAYIVARLAAVEQKRAV